MLPIAALFLMGSFSLVQSQAQAQQQIPPVTRPVSPGQAPNPGNPADENDTEMGRRQMVEMAKRRNTQRQQELVNDTNKLFELAQQLKDEVGKSNKDQLSLPVVKKAEEIEKLAKAVKEKMKGS